MTETRVVTKVVLFTCLVIENINEYKNSFDNISNVCQNIRDCKFSCRTFWKMAATAVIAKIWLRSRLKKISKDHITFVPSYILVYKSTWFLLSLKTNTFISVIKYQLLFHICHRVCIPFANWHLFSHCFF